MPCRTLSDVRQRGFLDLVDFTVAMYLIQALMTGKLSTVPVSLPQRGFTPHKEPQTHPLRHTLINYNPWAAVTPCLNNTVGTELGGMSPTSVTTAVMCDAGVRS